MKHDINTILKLTDSIVNLSFTTYQSSIVTNCNRRPRLSNHVTIKEGILGRLLVSDRSIFVSLNSQPWWHEVLVLCKVEMKWHPKSFHIVVPHSGILGVSLVPGVSVQIVWEKSVFLINLERRCDIVFWYCIKAKKRCFEMSATVLSGLVVVTKRD